MRRRKANVPMGSFNPSYHYEMLIDRRRVDPYKAAIEANVTPSSAVLDIGTGSGLLAILAARAGARAVYAVERMADMRRIATENFERENNPALRTPIIATDANEHLDLEEPIDVLLCELLSTWLVTEQQASVCRSVRSQLAPDAKIIPARMKNYLTGVQASLDYFGATIQHPYYLRELNNSRPARLTETILTHVTDFGSVDDMDVTLPALKVRCHTAGTLNAVMLESDAELDDTLLVDAGQTLFLPHVVPLRRPVEVRPGSVVSVAIDYSYGGDWTNFSAIAKVEEE
jgi:predicted RNA methylase